MSETSLKSAVSPENPESTMDVDINVSTLYNTQVRDGYGSPQASNVLPEFHMIHAGSS